MKRAVAIKMYSSITDIRDEFIEEAQTVRSKRRNRSWIGWCAAAACLCLVVGVLLLPKGSQIEEKEMDLEEITASYGGNLLVERLASSGATTNSVLLSYAKGGDVSDPAAWNTLSITGEYNGQDFTLNCNFDSHEDRKDPAGAYTVTQYGDVEVVIYQEESDWRDSYLFYRADFVLDDITYNLSVHSDSLEDIFAYLDMILGKQESSENPPGARLTDVLGFDVCRVEMEEITPWTYMWHYYVEIDGEDICVAEQFGDDGPESWSRDLDGDGVPELICNNTYGDGAQVVTVYRNRDGVIEEGNIKWSYYEEKFGWSHLGEGGISSHPVEKYDPEKGVFTATDYYTNGYDNPVTVEFDDGMEPFNFLSFHHLP